MYLRRKRHASTMSLNEWERLSAICQPKVRRRALPSVAVDTENSHKLPSPSTRGTSAKAIRAHPNDLEAMKNAVFATFHHAISTDEKLDHDLCPKGNESWCFYQKAIAAGEVQGSLGRLSLKKSVPLSRTCMCALAIQTFWGDASWVKHRTQTNLSIRLS